MKRLQNVSLALLTVAGLSVPLCAKDQGFAGKWVLDKKNTNAPQAPEDLREEIKQSGSDFMIMSRYREPANGITPLLYLGVMAGTIRLSTNGQESPNQIGPFQMVYKTTLEGNKMETDWNGVVNGDPVQGHWTRTLSDDGKHMTLVIKESSTKGQSGDATLQFVRK